MILLQLTEQVGAPIAPADPTEEIEPQELKDLARSLPVAQFTLQVSGAWKGVKQSLCITAASQPLHSQGFEGLLSEGTFFLASRISISDAPLKLLKLVMACRLH